MVQERIFEAFSVDLDSPDNQDHGAMISDQPQRCRKVTSESEIAMKDFSAFFGGVYNGLLQHNNYHDNPPDAQKKQFTLIDNPRTNPQSNIYPQELDDVRYKIADQEQCGFIHLVPQFPASLAAAEKS